jgi:hypothetical protein
MLQMGARFSWATPMRDPATVVAILSSNRVDSMRQASMSRERLMSYDVYMRMVPSTHRYTGS